MHLIFEHEIKPVPCSLLGLFNHTNMATITLSISPESIEYLSSTQPLWNHAYLIMDNGRTGAVLFTILLKPELEELIAIAYEISDDLRAYSQADGRTAWSRIDHMRFYTSGSIRTSWPSYGFS